MKGATAACLVVLAVALHGVERGVRVGRDWLADGHGPERYRRVHSTPYLSSHPHNEPNRLKRPSRKNHYISIFDKSNICSDWYDRKAFLSVFCTPRFLGKVL